MVAKTRDDFKPDVKDILAKRVGMKCANPNCRRPTSGPQVDPDKTLNIGVAAHIAAASKGGPRFDAAMTPKERSASTNGIWLCQVCAKLIDNDTQRYTAGVLQEWRRISEEAALFDVEMPGVTLTPVDDVDIIRFYAQCFDRAAFQDHFHREGSLEDFDKAIEDTIIAVNTGLLRARDGKALDKSKGKAFLRNSAWRQRMDVIVELLRSIRSRFEDARRSGTIKVYGNTYDISDHEVAQWMDLTRMQILEVFAEVCVSAGLDVRKFPRHH